MLSKNQQKYKLVAFQQPTKDPRSHPICFRYMGQGEYTQITEGIEAENVIFQLEEEEVNPWRKT